MKKKIIISLYFISAILSVKNVIAETPVEYPYPETKEIHLHNNKNGQLKGVLQINNPGIRHGLYKRGRRIEIWNAVILFIHLLLGLNPEIN